MGLTRAFLYAGAPTVGVSLWSVADKSTADLMTDFYKRLLSSPAAASRWRVSLCRNARRATRHDCWKEIQRPVLLGAVCSGW